MVGGASNDDVGLFIFQGLHRCSVVVAMAMDHPAMGEMGHGDAARWRTWCFKLLR